MSVESERRMKGSLKKFDSGEHNVYDVKGKDAMMAYLNRRFPKYKTIENPNKHGIDLLTLNDDERVVACWEIEVRYGNWSGDIKFPFSEINCIERKDYQWRKEFSFTEKIPFKLAVGYEVTYVQLNKECTRAVLIKSTTILKYPLKPWANRKADNEYVRQVPIGETVQLKIA